MKAKITPIKKQSTPQYPDQYSVQLNHLLLANKPLRWNAVPVAGTVLSAVVLLGLAGCNTETVTMGSSVPPPISHMTSSGASQSKTSSSNSSDELFVTMGVPTPPPILHQTPFFEHGHGVGAYGCVSVTAPVFLSEDDAFAIIKDEFEKLNLMVPKGGDTIGNIQIPKVNPYALSGDGTQTQKGDLKFDFAVRNINMEFVSVDDLNMWQDKDIGMGLTVWGYNFKEAARTLNDSLNGADTYKVHGVFYDPAESYNVIEGISEAVDWQAVREQRAEEARQQAADALREQVRDFLAWLSAQGII